MERELLRVAIITGLLGEHASEGKYKAGTEQVSESIHLHLKTVTPAFASERDDLLRQARGTVAPDDVSETVLLRELGQNLVSQ